MNNKYDLIIIGAGVLGAFHAYHALKMGYTVLMVEKDYQPQEATVRNFGQVVPSGMNSKWQAYGRESLKIYKEIQAITDISIRQNGSVYLASDEQEEALLDELCAINKTNDYASIRWSKTECLTKFSGLKSDYVRSGLYFPDEVTVEPDRMIHQFLDYLVTSLGLSLVTNQLVIHCEEVNGQVEVHTAGGTCFLGAKALICSGRDFKALFPEIFLNSDLEVSKLQMMKTISQGKEYSLPGSILTGWSIRRYEAFAECPSFAAIKALENEYSPQKKWGVHILFKQAEDGSVIIGDSHQYADASSVETLGFDLDMAIDDFMIAEARKIIELPTYEIGQRWWGMYSQCKTSDIFQKNIGNTIQILTGIGGKGMTGSAGFSKENIKSILNSK